MDTNDVTTVASAPAANELTITLRKAVTSPAGRHEVLKLHEPTVGQMLGWADLAGIERDIRAVATIAAIPESAVGQIGARDFLAAARFVHSFALVSDELDDSPAEFTVALVPPVEWEGTTFAHLSLREPLATELIEWHKADGLAGDMKVVAAVSGVPEGALRRIKASAFVEAAAYLSGFFVPSLLDGAAS